MSNVIEIKESYLCYGCGACNVVCAAQAITMKYDNIGRLQPEVDQEKCTNCGLCMKHCPSLDLNGIQYPATKDSYIGEVRNVYIGKSNNERIFRNSQSGGLVTTILNYLFETGKIDGAIVCRVDYSQEYLPKAIVVTNVEELYDCQKSSYVPVDMVSALKGVENLQSIAVVGTGCHIQGFRALCNFKKEYRDKIKYTLGLICDRTLCKTITEVLGRDIYVGKKKKIVWRDKSKGYKNPRLLIKSEIGKEREEPQWKRHALKDPFTNPRCRICFDKLNVHSDIVLGDPWGMSNVDWQNGASVVLVRSDLGEDIIDDMQSMQLIDLRKASLDEVISGQHILLRKKTVSDAISVYQDNNWLLPSYSNRLKSEEQYGYKKDLEYKIHNFVSDCLKEQSELVSQNMVYLKKIRLKTHVSRLLYPLYVIKHIITR
jgi:coenzyme F420 hydrogenase subunit beta